jgi:hypothetical protein
MHWWKNQKRRRKMKRLFFGEEIELPEALIIPQNHRCIMFSKEVMDDSNYFTEKTDNFCNLLEKIGVREAILFLEELKFQMFAPSLGNLLAFIACKKEGVDKREESSVRTERVNETIKVLSFLMEFLEKIKKGEEK